MSHSCFFIYKAENQARAGAANAIETMIKLINSHINNPSLCELGLIALWNMTFNSKHNHVFFAISFVVKISTTSAESQSRAVEAGGIETILKAIDTHITNSDVCEQGCGALWNLTLIRSLFSCSCLCEMCSSSDDNKKKAAAAGGIGLVIRAMEIHITNPSVCEQGCGVLWNMSVNNRK